RVGIDEHRVLAGQRRVRGKMRGDRGLAHAALGTGHQNRLHALTSGRTGPARVHRAGGRRERRVCYLHAPVPPPVRLMSELQDLAALIRAGTPLIVVETPDEPRVVEMFRQTLTRVWRAMYRWTITEG